MKSEAKYKKIALNESQSNKRDLNNNI